jgi:putative protease
LEGFRVNRVEAGKIFPAEMPSLIFGTTLYRNYDHEFEKTLSKKSAERKIGVELELTENGFGFSLTATDEDFCRVTVALPFAKEPAQKDQTANYREQLSKLGNTPFELNQLTIAVNGSRFIPSSVLSDLKRRTIERLLSARKINYKSGLLRCKRLAMTGCYGYRLSVDRSPDSGGGLTYLANVANANAEAFYSLCGAQRIEPAFEIQMQENVPLMFTKHCILYQLGRCKREKKTSPDISGIKEPLYLVTGKHRLQLQFDCLECEMRVIQSFFTL